MYKLNIGCGHNTLPPEEGWRNLDLALLPGVTDVFDLRTISHGNHLPFPDQSVSELLMSHVLEHLTNSLDVMQELWRVAKPGALLTIHVPYGSSDIAYEDPTHVRQYFANSFMYFGQSAYARADYGYRGNWSVQQRLLIISPSIHKNDLPDTPAEFMQIVNTYRNIIEEMICVLRAEDLSTPTEKQAPISFAFRKDLHNVA